MPALLPIDRVGTSSFPPSGSMPQSSQWECHQMATWKYPLRSRGMEWAGTNMAHIRETRGVPSSMDTLIGQAGRPQSSGNCETSILETSL